LSLRYFFSAVNLFDCCFAGGLTEDRFETSEERKYTPQESAVEGTLSNEENFFWLTIFQTPQCDNHSL